LDAPRQPHRPAGWQFYLVLPTHRGNPLPGQIELIAHRLAFNGSQRWQLLDEYVATNFFAINGRYEVKK
jgi:hypothetical protein